MPAVTVGSLEPRAEFRTLCTGRLGTVMGVARKRGEVAVEAIVEPLPGQGLVGVAVWLHPEVKVEVAA